MPKPLPKILEQIAAKNPPSVILIGGTSEFLSERAFREIREAMVKANPSPNIE